jgi:GNAT superfamily N-acetyltransferase
LGSIQAFPPRIHGPATIADVWRAGPVPGSGVVKVRETRLEDYAAIRALQRVAAPYTTPWTLKQFESQRLAFPEGQMVAVCEGHVVGVASSLVVRWDDYNAQPTWRSITAEGHFTTHDSTGHTLYGADLVVDSTRRGFGVGRALFQARRRLCRRLNLRRIIATTRLPGYGARREALTPEQYAMRVVWGDIADPAMRFLMAQGFQYCGILHDYLPEDAESCGHAALLAWLNPLFAPPGPTASEEAQRQRKCA